MTDVPLPDWWTWPAQCQHGHPWGPGRITLGWLPCQCAKAGPGAGHRTVSCREPGCRSVWYEPPHDFVAASEGPPF